MRKLFAAVLLLALSACSAPAAAPAPVDLGSSSGTSTGGDLAEECSAGSTSTGEAVASAPSALPAIEVVVQGGPLRPGK